LRLYSLGQAAEWLEAEMSGLTLKEIADYFCKNYPKATQIIFSVGHHGYKVAVENFHKTTGLFTTRTLDGEWLEEEKK
jgi:hypothetical protein